MKEIKGWEETDRLLREVAMGEVITHEDGAKLFRKLNMLKDASIIFMKAVKDDMNILSEHGKEIVNFLLDIDKVMDKTMDKLKSFRDAHPELGDLKSFKIKQNVVFENKSIIIEE